MPVSSFNIPNTFFGTCLWCKDSPTTFLDKRNYAKPFGSSQPKCSDAFQPRYAQRMAKSHALMGDAESVVKTIQDSDNLYLKELQSSMLSTANIDFI